MKKIKYFEASIRIDDDSTSKNYKNEADAVAAVERAFKKHLKMVQKLEIEGKATRIEVRDDVLAALNNPNNPDTKFGRRIVWAKPHPGDLVSWNKDYFYVTRRTLKLA